jgi:UDP-GlcNAc:undecaprenyl-phosphate/decaprenyl-phosphate GlcNAc-1-phosphate transferase
VLPTILIILSIGYIFSRCFIFKIAQLCRHLNYVDHPNERKIQAVAIPYGGGIVLLLGCFFWGIVLFLGYELGLWAMVWPDQEILPEKLIQSDMVLSVGFGLLVMFGLGYLDDIFDCSPKLKLLVQFLTVAGVLKWSGLGMAYFWDQPWLGFILTVLWVVLITNAFNLIDNMDGYCSSVAIISLVVHVVLQVIHGHHLVAFATVMVLGPLLAFGQVNWPPAKLYLGDAGSLSLGFLMALLSIASTYYHPGQSLASYLTPILILAIPLFDVATVMWIRFRTKQPFFKGDRNHFSHRLMALGLSTRQALAVIIGMSCVTGLAAIGVNLGSNRVAVAVFLQIVAVLGLVLVLERAGRQKCESKK